jgi:hypothetical protein
MSRIRAVVAVGTIASALGLFLCLRAGNLATNWQPTESGNGWGGRTDPALQHTYFTLGLVGLCFGLVLLSAATWAWLNSRAVNSPRPPIEA